MKEKRVEDAIKNYVSSFEPKNGNLCFKVMGTAFTIAGVPDLIGIFNPSLEQGRGVVFFVEVKRPNGTRSPKQEIFLDIIRYAANPQFVVVGFVESLDEFKRLFDDIQ